MEQKRSFSSKKIIRLISLIILLGAVVFGGLFLSDYWNKKRNSRPENLAKLIKTELVSEKEKITKGEKWKTEYSFWKKNGVIWTKSRLLRKKTGKSEVKPADLAKKDWDEIVNLIHQNKSLCFKKVSEKNKEIEKKLENDDNPQLFCYHLKAPAKVFLKKGERRKYLFWGWDEEKKDTYDLVISENHPALTKISFQKYQYYLIKGVKNAPFCQGCFGEEKVVQLTDKITITSC